MPVDQWRLAMDRLSSVIPSDRLNALLGILLFLSPWLMDFSSHGNAALSAQIAGAVIFSLAIAEMLAFNVWEEWIGCATGVWLLLAPWLFGFSEVPGLVAIHFSAGLLTILFTIWSLSDHTIGGPASH